jgi:hypothetical protein
MPTFVSNRHFLLWTIIKILNFIAYYIRYSIQKTITFVRTVKKITAILLLSLYSLSTLGLSLKSFYCCGNLKSVTVSISQHEQKTCANGDGKSDCCKTKYQFFKVKDNHVASDVLTAPVLHFCYLHLFTSPYQIINYPSEKDEVANLTNAPPLLHTVPGYIFNCVFRV